MRRDGISVVEMGIIMDAEPYHKPVMLEEVIEYLAPGPGGRYLDGTIGGGGHARAILEASYPNGEVWGVDLDEDAIRYCGSRLEEFGDRIHLIRENYSRLEHSLEGITFDGALLDIGVSSFQIDNPDRGFSSRLNAPLDMRFDNRSGETASFILNTSPEERLADIFHTFGEERNSKRIARAVVSAREKGPIEESQRLVDIILRVVPRDHEHKSIARIFQALRISVNHELENLERGLESIFGMLGAGGRLVVVSYHSGEDRIVKNFFRYLESSCICPPGIPECRCEKESVAEILTRKPVQPSTQEIESNPRARAAKLRAISKKST